MVDCELQHVKDTGYGIVEMDLAAPGRIPKGTNLSGLCKGYEGTSVACAIASGAAAIAWSDAKSNTITDPADIRALLMQKVKKNPPDLSKVCASGGMIWLDYWK